MVKIMSVRPLKRLRPLSPFQSPKKPSSPSQWEEILRIWSKLDNMSTLKNESGRICNRFVIDANKATETTVTVTQMKSLGLHSQIFSIQLNDTLAPVVLKKHTSSDDSNVAPEIEAELQKWAHKHGLAPEVKAYNAKAMIIEKCQKPLDEKPLEQGYAYSRGLSRKRFLVNTLNRALGKGSLSMFKFILRMYDTCGLYNRDPNFDNYMYLRKTLVQIDYGQNRFTSQAEFSKWFSQIPDKLRGNRSALLTKLVVNDSEFPPLFQWYEVHISTDTEEYRRWSRQQWVTSILAFKQRRQLLIHQLEQERKVLLEPAESIPTRLLF